MSPNPVGTHPLLSDRRSRALGDSPTPCVTRPAQGRGLTWRTAAAALCRPPGVSVANQRGITTVIGLGIEPNPRMTIGEAWRMVTP